MIDLCWGLPFNNAMSCKMVLMSLWSSTICSNFEIRQHLTLVPRSMLHTADNPSRISNLSLSAIAVAKWSIPINMGRSSALRQYLWMPLSRSDVFLARYFKLLFAGLQRLTSPGRQTTKRLDLCPAMYELDILKNCTNFPKSRRCRDPLFWYRSSCLPLNPALMFVSVTPCLSSVRAYSRRLS